MPLEKVIGVILLFLLVDCSSNRTTIPEENTQIDEAGPALEIADSGTVVEDLPDAELSFVAFGDWGSGNEYQLEVADSIADYCAEKMCDFIVTLGDNFYENGVSGTDDPQWQTKYKDVYGNLNLPFYPTLGNHDYYGNYQAQIDYSTIDSSWRLPTEQYSFLWPENSTDPLAQFFVIQGNRQYTSDDKEWLENEIEESRAQWKFVTRHWPFMSNLHDAGETDDPLLEDIICNKIDIILSGHDHLFTFERGEEDGCWMEQLIIGTGGIGHEPQSANTDEGRLVTTASLIGFGWFQVSQSKVLFRMISSDGFEVYSTTWTRRGQDLD